MGSTDPLPYHAEDPQITRRRIAELADVTRPTVTVWERRSADFPTPRRADGTGYFLQSDILGWLDGRPVPLHLRQPGEGPNATYGARARRSLAGVRGEQPDQPARAVARFPTQPSRPLTTERPDQRDRAVVQELMGRLADQVRGSGSMENYLHLVFGVQYLRATSGDRWETVRARSEAAAKAGNGHGRSGAAGTGATGAELLDLIGRTVDEEVRRLGMLRSFTASLSKLTPRKAGDVARVVDLVGRLGDNAFQLVIDEYERHARLRSREFFTPQGLVRVMAAIARTSLGRAPLTVYDPYVRGGEFLAESVAVSEGVRTMHPEAEPVKVFGQTTSPDAALLASLNLALRGVRPRVRLVREAPWAAVRDGEGPAADLVLTNPPFNMKDSAGEVCRTGTWAYGAPPRDNDNLAYAQHVLASLRPGGRAAIVMPNKAGNSRSGAETAIRGAIVEAGVLECVIGMPAKLFSGTAVPVSVWLLRHPAEPCDGVLFLDARHLGVKKGSRRVLSEDDLQVILDTYRKESGHLPPLTYPAYEDQYGPYGSRPVPSALVERQRILDRDCSLNPLDHISAKGVVADGEANSAEDASSRAWLEVEVLRESSIQKDAHAASLCGEDGMGGSDWGDGQEWIDAKLADLCEIKAGPSFTRVGSKDRGPDEPVPVVFPRHLKDGRVTDTGVDRVSVELADRHPHYRLREGDILCVRSGKTARPALVQAEQTGWLMSPNVIRLRVREDREVDPEYLLGWLSRPESIAWIEDRSAATAAPSISTASLGGMTVRLPGLERQLRIAELLHGLEEQARAHLELATAVTRARALLAEQLMGRASQLRPFSSS
ncbi:N-6 DNA methylase [Streptomyces goshikiensis]|uniref:N-6 DNA methylase n=1 Tax=Streptomyces goshikiensis TaxID=1942 RepID=UPI003828E57A